MKFHRTQFAAAILGGLLLLGASSTLQAQGGFVPDDYQGPQRYQGLTPQQEKQAQQIHNEMMGKFTATQQAIAAKQDQLDQIMAARNPDSAAIQRLSREIGELQGQALTLQAEARSRFAQAGINPNTPTGNWYDCPWMMGEGGYYHHGGRHGWHRGHGHWRGYCPGMGMMRGW